MSLYVKTLEQFLNYCTEKNKVISNNISNAGTPNYKREDVEFNALLNDGISKYDNNPKHIPLNGQSGDSLSITTDNSADLLSGTNNVDIEKEMSELAGNSIAFKLGSKMMGDYYKAVQYAIKGDK